MQPRPLRFDHSALPSAAGGVVFLTTPASAMAVKTYGIICTNCDGIPRVPCGLTCAAFGSREQQAASGEFGIGRGERQAFAARPRLASATGTGQLADSSGDGRRWGA